MISRALAKHLHSAGLAVYDPTGTSGSCFLEHLPPAPDVALMILSSGGNPTPAAATWGYDEPTLQLMTRGEPNDPEAPATWAGALYDALQGLRYTTLDEGGADEVRLVVCTFAQSAPINIGPDAKGRYRYTLNPALHVRAITAHRD